MKFITSLIVAFIVCVSNVFATAQTPDYVIYEGEKYDLFTNPLDSFFEKNPDKKPESHSSGNWRGYIATFAVTNNTLVLKSIETEVYTNDTYSTVSIKEKVFANTDDQPINWFTGVLTLPQGEQVNYVHMGYGSTYENYILLEVKNGELKKVRNLDSKEYELFRNRQYEAFKKTKIYKDTVKKELGGSVTDRDERFMRSFFSGTYTSILLDE